MIRRGKIHLQGLNRERERHSGEFLITPSNGGKFSSYAKGMRLYTRVFETARCRLFGVFVGEKDLSVRRRRPFGILGGGAMGTSKS